MQKVMNFRDLGGIKTADGRVVKKGLFFRSAMLDEATEEDILFLKGLGLKVIFDYRNVQESKILSSKEANVYKRLGVHHASHPAALNNQKLFRLNKTKGFRKLLLKVEMSDVQNTYKSLPFSNEGYKAMITALRHGNVPFLQHCSAGKDRAGMGSALLLAILGVKHEDILEDYMKSLAVRSYVEEKAAGFIPKIFRRALLKRYEPLFIVHEKLIEASLDAIMEKYGSFETYLEKEYELDNKTVLALRDKYTEI